jgi:translocation and assembly module TamA
LPRPSRRPVPASARSRTLLLLLVLAAGAGAATPVLEVTGGDDALRERVRTRFDDAGLACDAPRWIARRALDGLRSAARTRLRADGFYSPTLTTDLVREQECWRLTVDVARGEATVLAALSVGLTGAGREDEALAAAVREPGLARGERFREADYETLKRRLQRIALERGYFDARFETAVVDVWPERAEAEVTLRMDTGARYALGSLDLAVTPVALSESLVQRFGRWAPGEPYTQEAIQGLRERLLEAGYFRDVDVRARPEARKDGRVPVTASASLRKRHHAAVGAGYTTDFGPRLRTEYDNRYVTRSGHQASTSLNLSPVVQELRGSWRMPVAGRRDPWLVIDGGYLAEETDTNDSESLTLGVRRIHGGRWRTRVTEFVDLVREDYDVATDGGVAVLVMPGLGIGRNERRRAEPLEIGWRAETSVRGAAEPLSTTSFTQARGTFETALPLGDRGRVITRLDLGFTWTGALEDLPTSVRFFAGGDRSIRGYGLDDLGPEADNGEVRGGRHLAVGSLEVEHMVWRRFSAAVFVDTGGAFNDFSEPVSTGVGFGVRWASPVGPIRLDVGVPLDDPDRNFRIHFGIGGSFR